MNMNESHDIRELRRRVKALGKANGRAGQTIHLLRAELAEQRELCDKFERGAVRDLERDVENLLALLDKRNDTIERLREKLAAATKVATDA